MTKEEKQLLLTDLCARLPYGLFCQTDDGKGKLISVECSFGDDLVYVDFGYPEAKEYDLNEGDSVKPYLRPMSSMTSEEKNTFEFFVTCNTSDTLDSISWANIQNLSIVRDSCDFIDWLNEHHLDYRGLIDKELALEAPKDMYKN